MVKEFKCILNVHLNEEKKKFAFPWFLGDKKENTPFLFVNWSKKWIKKMKFKSLEADIMGRDVHFFNHIQKGRVNFF